LMYNFLDLNHQAFEYKSSKTITNQYNWNTPKDIIPTQMFFCINSTFGQHALLLNKYLLKGTMSKLYIKITIQDLQC
jgi:type IV secretory pathway VirB4 component